MDGGGGLPHNSSSTGEESSSAPNSIKMEDSFQSLVFKGPVPQAIIATKMSMKILFVYIGGSDEVSDHLEQSTWQDSEVISLLSEHCVVLHLLQGSADAVHFSAIYPYVSVPALSAVGHNGMLLWHHEGYISAKDLIASVNKARTELHSQEMAAVNMIAAAIRQAPMNNTPSSNVTHPLHEGITDKVDPSSMGQIPLQLPRSPTVCESLLGTEETEQTSPASRAVEQEDMASASAVPMSATPSRPSNTISSECVNIPGFNHSSSLVVKAPEISSPTNPTVIETTTEMGEPEECANMSAINSGNSSSQTGDKVNSDYPKENKLETLETDCKSWRKETRSVTSSDLKVSTTEIVPEVEASNEDCNSIMDNTPAMKSPTKDLSSIHLQIRLLNGASLQAKFSATDTLRSVKDFISENRTDGNRPFSLGIPYPRKVFTGQDMEKVLLELNLGTRAAIILVPFQSAKDTSDWHSLSQANSLGVPSSPQSGDLGPGFLSRILSYLNPFSYFVGNSSNQESSSGNSAWQYDPNPSAQSAFKDGGSGVAHSSKFNISGKGQKVGSGSKVEKRRGWGSNIHTLRPDEDEKFRDQNAYWNGNSTQFGGGDNKRD